MYQVKALHTFAHVLCLLRSWKRNTVRSLATRLRHDVGFLMQLNILVGEAGTWLPFLSFHLSTVQVRKPQHAWYPGMSIIHDAIFTDTSRLRRALAMNLGSKNGPSLCSLSEALSAARIASQLTITFMLWPLRDSSSSSGKFTHAFGAALLLRRHGGLRCCGLLYADYRAIPLLWGIPPVVLLRASYSIVHWTRTQAVESSEDGS
ncbi:hypothetical protein BXZ70DRAFT_908190 [Cristinia sonorae]|uniref:Uncharacterized protein n=1 Tax=Cristinia sonorae TaxID=1940300 RepID=A0A8K0UMH2_9AGAR|nr:hypothetical protein BXZ70DRAFT_908190 [Cristinia sonorae]